MHLITVLALQLASSVIKAGLVANDVDETLHRFLISKFSKFAIPIFLRLSPHFSFLHSMPQSIMCNAEEKCASEG